jgi:hypothetical protein
MGSAVVLEPEQHSVGGFSLSWLVGSFGFLTALRAPMLHSNAAIRAVARSKTTLVAFHGSQSLQWQWHAS